jgi:hypothetical protein
MPVDGEASGLARSDGQGSALATGWPGARRSEDVGAYGISYSSTGTRGARGPLYTKLAWRFVRADAARWRVRRARTPWIGAKEADAEAVTRILEGIQEMAGILPFTLETAARYDIIRARHGVSPADAIHLACAAEARVDLCLTTDAHLAGKVIPGIRFIAGLDVDLQ